MSLLASPVLAGPVLAGIIGSLAAGLATGLGALAILARGRFRVWNDAALLGFAAGVMLAASFFSLVVPALAITAEAGMGAWARSALVTGSIVVGALGIGLLERYMPAIESLAGTEKARRLHNRPTWLLIAGITLHNIPEGAAVALSFAGGDRSAGLSTALGIGIQNIPEGLAVAGALATLGFGPARAALGGLASGLIEPVAGTISALLVTWMAMLLPVGLGLAAGAMIAVVAVQLIPDVARREDGKSWPNSFFAGLALMLFLDTALG